MRPYSSIGRAAALQAAGSRFESSWGHAHGLVHLMTKLAYLRCTRMPWGCSSIGRAPRWLREGSGFESRCLHVHQGPLAQWESASENEDVPGSIPGWATGRCGHAPGADTSYPRAEVPLRAAKNVRDTCGMKPKRIGAALWSQYIAGSSPVFPPQGRASR